MTREHKLALIIGFSLVLFVFVVIGDHLSAARQAELVALDGTSEGLPGLTIPELSETLNLLVNPTKVVRQPEIVRQPEVVIRQGTDGGVERPGQEPEQVQIVVLPDAGPTLGPVQSVRSGAQEMSPARVGASSQGQDRVASTSPMIGVTEPRQEEAARVHHVQAGEGLYKIAKRYYGDGDLWPKLAEFNQGRVGENGMIRIGVRLQIPPQSVLRGPSRGRKVPAKPELRVSPARIPVMMASYTVRNGDTLGEISQRLLGTVRRTPEIIKLNRLEDADSIRSGMVLTIPKS